MTLTEPLIYSSTEVTFTFNPNNNYLERVDDKRTLLDPMNDTVHLECEQGNGRAFISLKNKNMGSVILYRPIVDKEEYDKMCSFFKAILLHVLATKQPQVLSL